VNLDGKHQEKVQLTSAMLESSVFMPTTELDADAQVFISRSRSCGVFSFQHVPPPVQVAIPRQSAAQSPHRATRLYRNFTLGT